jgi:hypothetical protein
MNRPFFILMILLLGTGCNKSDKASKRLPVAEINNTILYYDEIPHLIQKGINNDDSAAIIQNYINKWARRELLLQKAEENLSPEIRNDIERQLEETRTNLVIYQYQRQMMLEKMDTLISDKELEDYYAANEKSFYLTSNIVKALFIKLPVETPDLDKIKILARSNNQSDLQQLEKYCFQFAEKFDDFGEKWIPMSRLLIELNEDISDEDSETSDSASVFLVSIRDYRLRSSLAPFDYVKDDIKKIIWNARRFEFIQSLENGIYNDALKKNGFKIY